jgi:hypothetical protein
MQMTVQCMAAGRVETEVNRVNLVIELDRVLDLISLGGSSNLVEFNAKKTQVFTRVYGKKVAIPTPCNSSGYISEPTEQHQHARYNDPQRSEPKGLHRSCDHLVLFSNFSY